MKAELHYLLILGSKQKQLILYNLKDAIDDLPANMGIKAHCSYWINRSHITKVIKHGREAKVIVSNGSEIPVSRANVPLFHEFF